MRWPWLWKPLTSRLFSAAPDYDRQTIAIMERLLGREASYVDVGAHSGALLRHAVRVAPTGTHYAFEPLPSFHATLVARYPSVRVLPIALGNSTGMSRFQHVVTNPAYSGFRRRRYETDNERIEEIEVATGRLDDLLPSTLPVSFIKVDVEGAELDVLRGAAETVRRCRPAIVFEHGLGAADYYGATPQQLFDLLVQEYRLSIFVMSDWLRRRAPLDRAQFCAQFAECANYVFLACGKAASSRRHP